MKKALFLFLLISILSLSCTNKHDRNTEKTSGKINTISVIIDDPLWNGEVGDSIRNKFASPVIGLPQEEPLFTINQYPIKLLEGFVTKTRNSIVIKKEAKNNFEVIENEYASPQNVFHISGNTSASIIDLIEKNAPAIIQKMRQTEIKENQRIIDTSRIKTKKIQRKFNIDLHIPKGYIYVLERKKFMWLKKEITSGNTSILIYQIPLSSLNRNSNVVNRIIKIRDSIGNLYIHGTIPRTHMITEDSYAPYLFHIKINGKETFETKGTWELKNDYMSGPFINYTILDRANKRILILEGFCYDPSKEKRDLMFELEAIIKSIEFRKKTEQINPNQNSINKK
ncbi:DUF4837 family protein [Flavobacterium psychrotolerans]|uniref:DUF4837 domain-containing protein n=1 Tax=Flavobacterium psychrotolerans TaxID=2169410 RepID=A0A2U1JKS7_9FLAO|nr:DUF4837 family protein [Flavobacterium psychrotolerans]PWA05579.1 DUF4837 domain-containing protein [Flavobacterium psychrotolerans]